MQISRDRPPAPHRSVQSSQARDAGPNYELSNDSKTMSSPVPFGLPLDLDPTHLQLCLPTDLHSYSTPNRRRLIIRPNLFIGDMKGFGAYYSHTLLSAILSHSIRWCRTDPNIFEALAPYESGHLFSYHARTLLHADLQNGTCDIPTIQTLLLISAQECGHGNCTQAWMYSGIAFRLAEDLGITIDARKYAGSVKFSEEDIEIRNRLFWSCYIWDKMISLYMGRRPLIHCSDVSPPQVMSQCPLLILAKPD